MVERASLFVSNAPGVPGPITALDGRYGLAAGFTGAGPVTARSGFRPAAASPAAATATSPTPDGRVWVAPFHRVHQSGRTGGVYVQTLDTSWSYDVLTAHPPHASNPRNDLIICHQQDTQFSEPDSLMRIRYVPGNPDPAPADPPLSAYPDHWVIARVRVGAGAAAITGAMIDDLRPTGLYTVSSGGVLPITSLTERNAISPHPGMWIDRLDKGWAERWDGTAWRVPYLVGVAALGDITHPTTGQLAYLLSDRVVYRYTGSGWSKHLVGTRVETATQTTSPFQAMTTGAADLAGASITLNTVSANALVTATGFFDVEAGGASSAFRGSLVVDGATATGQVTSRVLGRVTISRTWKVTLAGVGTHTLKLQGLKTSATDVVTTYGDVGGTGLTATVFDA